MQLNDPYMRLPVRRNIVVQGAGSWQKKKSHGTNAVTVTDINNVSLRRIFEYLYNIQPRQIQLPKNIIRDNVQEYPVTTLKWLLQILMF